MASIKSLRTDQQPGIAHALPESEKSFDWAKEEIAKKVGVKFYGSLTLHFQDGCIKIIEENHSMRPPYRE